MAFREAKADGYRITLTLGDLRRYRKVMRVMQTRDIGHGNKMYYMGKEQLLDELIKFITNEDQD